MASPDSIANAGGVRIALSKVAYATGTFRLVESDHAGFTHLVATRGGLFAVGLRGARLLAHGMFYGMTMAGDIIYLFEAGDLPRANGRHGRIVRLFDRDDRIVDTNILVTGLPDGCHQMEMIDGRLCLLDTYGQRVLRIDPATGAIDVVTPLSEAATGDWAGGYAHINSLVEHDGTIMLILHNGGHKTGNPSELATFDLGWRLIKRRPLPGFGCHNIVFTDGGEMLFCGSMDGELIGERDRRAAFGAVVTRGLAVDREMIAVGLTDFTEPAARLSARGRVSFLRRDYSVLAEVNLPAGPTEIRAFHQNG